MAAISWEQTGRKFIYDECFHDGFFYIPCLVAKSVHKCSVSWCITRIYQP